MKFSLHRSLCSLLLLLTLFAGSVHGATYTFSGASFPSCSSGWSSSGTTWTCTNSVTLASGDNILPASGITVVANAGLTLTGNNTIGSSSVTVNLKTTYGSFSSGSATTIYGAITTDAAITLSSTTVTGNITSDYGDITITNSTVNGNIVSSSGNITLTNSNINGSVTTNGKVSTSGGKVTGSVIGKNGVTATAGTIFGGNITAASGSISLTGGSVAGSVSSTCCAIATTNTNVGNGISSTNNDITINGGTITGNIYSAGGSGISISNATVLSATITDGSINATNVRINISNSTIGTASTPVDISTNNTVTISGSTIYGSVTAGSWSSALTIDSSSTVIGTCTSDTNSNVAPQNYPRCTGTNSTAKLNACHNYAGSSCSTSNGRLYTRIAGTAFTTDIVALKSDGTLDTSFTGKVTVSIIARAATGGALDANNCFTPDASQVVDNAATSFTAGRLTVTATVSSAYPDVRLKMVCSSSNCAPSGVTSCSADNFAIRPSAFGSVGLPASADTTGVSTTNTPTMAAGSSFTLTATALSGYNGTPKIDNTQVSAHTGASATGAIAGTFNAATVATGLASGSFAYSEVGYFRLNTNGIYDDTFTAVDKANGDCTSDFSNALVSNKYGCNFGNSSATSYVGRFIPDHFDTAITQYGCAAATKTAFTYSGQPLTLTITARNSSNATIQNYNGSFAKVQTLSARSADGSTANPGSGTMSPTTIAATTFSAGVSAGQTPSYTFGSKLTAENTVRFRVIDSDGASSSTGTEGSSPFRSGQLHLSNAFGSEKTTLSMPLQAQYWSGNSWVTNSDDSCTSIPTNAFSLTGSLATATSLNAAVTLTAGTSNAVLKAPSPTSTGSVDVAINLGSSGSDQSCLSSHGGTAASLSWLRSRNGSCVSTYDRDPSARATFGVYSPETKKTVHTRELF